jgi:tetratricopeptide (TPR) repeat protein
MWLLVTIVVTAARGAHATAQAPRPTAHEDPARALAEGANDRAIALARAAVKARPDDVAARVLLARAHLALGQLDAAEAQLQKAARVAPDDEHVLYYLGLVTSQQARRAFERLFSIAPDSARVHQLMAESLEAQERRAAAEQEYEAALRVNPELHEALIGLARLQRLRLDCEHAVDLYLRADRLRPSFEAAYGLGSCQLRQGQFGAALASLEQAVARDASAAHAWVALASARLGAGRAAEAVTALERAIALEPEMGEAYYTLGRVYQAIGNVAGAREAYERARELRVGEDPRPEQPQ